MVNFGLTCRYARLSETAIGTVLYAALRRGSQKAFQNPGPGCRSGPNAAFRYEGLSARNQGHGSYIAPSSTGRSLLSLRGHRRRHDAEFGPAKWDRRGRQNRGRCRQSDGSPSAPVRCDPALKRSAPAEQKRAGLEKRPRLPLSANNVPSTRPSPIGWDRPRVPNSSIISQVPS